MLSGATLSADAIAGTAVFRMVVSNDSMKNATATSQGSNRLLDAGKDGEVVRSGTVLKVLFRLAESIDSMLLLPKDLTGFKRHRGGWVKRHDARREVAGWTIARNARGVEKAATVDCDSAIHGFSDRISSIQALGEELDSHRVGIQSAQVDRNFKMMLTSIGFDSERTEGNAIPFGGDLLFPSLQFDAELASLPCPRRVVGSGVSIVVVGILSNHSIGGVFRGQFRHAVADASDPPFRNSRGVTFIELGHNLAFQQSVERVGVGAVDSGVVAMLAAVSDGPTYFRRIGFDPPPIQSREI